MIRKQIFTLALCAISYLQVTGAFKTAHGNPAQEEYIIIRNVEIEGNKRTKDKIILRELNFEISDTIPLKNLQIFLERNQELVFNSGLFNKVTLTVKDKTEAQATILISVEERWYIFPVPIFELVDRNFNVWWKDQNRDLARTVYGLRFYHENFRGRKERLKFVIQRGYTEKYELFYTIPFLDKKQMFGTKLFVSYSNNKEIAYNTILNKQQYIKSEDHIQSRFYSGFSLFRRKALFNSHFLKFEYHNNSISDTVVELNENYFSNGRNSQQYCFVEYVFENDKRDLKYYPLNGNITEIIVSKFGFGIFNDINTFEVMARHSRYWQIGEKEFVAVRIKAQLSFPEQQPYYNQYGLGFGQDFVRGYEFYAMENQHFGFFRSTLKHQFWDFELKDIPIVPIQFKKIPIDIYLKVFFDMGYGFENFNLSTNTFNKTIIPGWGIGLDVVTFYDMVIRMEYSFNNLLEKGLYLHFNLDI